MTLKEIQIHRIGTDEDSGLYKADKGRAILTRPDLFTKKDWTSQYIYATVSQEVEPIKDGDWFYNIKSNNVFHNDSGETIPKSDTEFKIIATTDKKLITGRKLMPDNTIFDPDSDWDLKYGVKSGFGLQRIQRDEKIPQFQQSFIKEYCDKGGIDKALADYDIINLEIIQKFERKEKITCDYELKVNSDNTIIIYPLEEKMYSKAEVILLARDAFNDSCKYTCFADWIKENL